MSTEESSPASGEKGRAEEAEASYEDEIDSAALSADVPLDSAPAFAAEGQRDTEEDALLLETLEASPRSPASAQDGGTANFLSMYFREMANLDIMRPEEELFTAQQIEALEMAVWEAILSYAPIADHVLKVVETCMESPAAEFRTLRRAIMQATDGSQHESRPLPMRQSAQKLRELDTEKKYLDAVLAELARIEHGASGRTVSKPLSFSHEEPGFVAYLQRVRDADGAAARVRNEFVKANLRLVVSIARRFNHGRMALADLIQEGNIGLMKAVERYDYRRGFRFSTYASWWIRHAISRALADKGREVRLPVHMIDIQYKLRNAKRELTAKLGRPPTYEELAEVTKIPADRIEKMRTYLIDQSFSLDRSVSDEESRTFGELLPDPDFEENSPIDLLTVHSLAEEVRQVLHTLKPLEADILRHRFGIDNDEELTLKEIGDKFNLSRERIRQLQEQALTKVRRALQRKEIF